MKYVLIPTVNKVVSISEMYVDFALLKITITSLESVTYVMDFETNEDLVKKLHIINDGFTGQDINTWSDYMFSLNV